MVESKSICLEPLALILTHQGLIRWGTQKYLKIEKDHYLIAGSVPISYKVFLESIF